MSSNLQQTKGKFPKKVVQLHDPYVTDYTSPLQQLPKAESDYVPLKLIGEIKEKGFSSEGAKQECITFPQPRATPFPVSRHRSEGPHWAPAVYQPSAVLEDREIIGGELVTDQVQPLQRKKKGESIFSKWNKQQIDMSMKGLANCKNVEAEASSSKIVQGLEKSSESLQDVDAETSSSKIVQGLEKSSESMQDLLIRTDSMTLSMEDHREADTNELELSKLRINDFSVPIDSSLQITSHVQCKEVFMDSVVSDRIVDASDSSIDSQTFKARGQDSLINTSSIYQEMDSIDAENRATVSSMSTAEIAEVQAELRERLRPDVLDMLMRRGMEKERKHIDHGEQVDGTKTHGFSGSTPENGSESQDPMKVLSPSSFATDKKTGSNANEKYADTAMLNVEETGDIKGADRRLCNLPTSAAPSEKSALKQAWESWTNRVEAVRSLKFGLDGNIVVSDHSSGENVVNANSWSVENVTERDILRTEGNPAGEGYSIKEAVALVRSMIPGQRTAALRLITLILDKVLHGYQAIPAEMNDLVTEESSHFVDWKAIWAYAIGPEPELVLTLRIALDDSHVTVVASCAKALQCLLSCSSNERYFDICEAIFPFDSNLCTAPIFRKITKQDEGFLGGGHWKYNVKHSQMFPFSDNSSSAQTGQGEATVGDDAAVASQDVVAGLIRMGILPRIRYILEVERLVAAEEHLFNVLIALSRHSPTTADAVMKCPRLVDTVLQYLNQDKNLDTGVRPARIKAVRLLRVLSQTRRSNCLRFLKMGVFQAAVLDLLQQGMILGTQKKAVQDSKGLCMGLIESLKLWKVCIQYLSGISFFSSFYPVLCFWILPPSVSELHSLTMESMALAKESFNVLEKLSRTLPVIHSEKQPKFQRELTLVDPEDSAYGPSNWAWSAAIPLIQTSLGWLSSGRISFLMQRLKQFDKGNADETVAKECNYFLGVLMSVFHFLSAVCERIIPFEDTLHACNERGSILGNSTLLWLPDFVPKLALELVGSGLFKSLVRKTENGVFFFPNVQTSFTECFPTLKGKFYDGTILLTTSCLHGLVRLLKILSYILETARDATSPGTFSDAQNDCDATKILNDGLVSSTQMEMMGLLVNVGNDVIKGSNILRVSEVNGRGGPAPGVGIGWGSQGGGYWSTSSLKAQLNARLATQLLQFLSMEMETDIAAGYEFTHLVWKLNVYLSAIGLAGPGDFDVVETVYSVILHEDMLMLLMKETDKFLENWLWKVEGGQKEQMQDMPKPDEMRKVLHQHFRSIWLQQKSKPNQEKEQEKSQPAIQDKSSNWRPMLATMDEDTSEILGTQSLYPQEIMDSLVGEWARQRLPLPSHWLLSPFSGINYLSRDSVKGEKATECLDEFLNSSNRHTLEEEELEKLVQSGLMLLAGLEALANKVEDNQPLQICHVPFARKIHALSCIFLLGDTVFLNAGIRAMIGALQELYGMLLDKHSLKSISVTEHEVRETQGSQQCYEDADEHLLDFEGVIDTRYSEFVEQLANQFAAASFGDLVFGRQIAIYLRRDVADSLRLKTWGILAEQHSLGLLPPLDKCCGGCNGYLQPPEENQDILRAYVSAWVSGALDKAVSCSVVTYALCLHHIASFLFSKNDQDGKLLLRKELSRMLIRGLEHRPQLQVSLLHLLRYDFQQFTAASEVINLQNDNHREELERRFLLFQDACEGYPGLNALLWRLHSFAFI